MDPGTYFWGVLNAKLQQSVELRPALPEST
jgi:hypothetical protein